MDMHKLPAQGQVSLQKLFFFASGSFDGSSPGHIAKVLSPLHRASVAGGQTQQFRFPPTKTSASFKCKP